MATIRQKQAMKKVRIAMENKESVNMGKIMRSVGYPESTSKNPKVLTESKAWQKSLAEINFDKQLKQVEELGDTEINNDKDNALKAKDMLFKLGDKYPKGETKIIGIFNKIEQISE
jgi:hypothetical protein